MTLRSYYTTHFIALLALVEGVSLIARRVNDGKTFAIFEPLVMSRGRRIKFLLHRWDSQKARKRFLTFYENSEKFYLLVP